MNTAPGRAAAWPMIVLTALFFMWGFITVLNDVLVPHWKVLFQLNYAESLLVQFCFFGAYFIGSLCYWWWSRTWGDPVRRLGYKRSMVAGLLISALGCTLFLPASLLHSYGAHLFALFVLGIGFTVLQIAANPFVAIIGPSEGASSRLNLAQAFNSLGTTLAPIIGGALIFAQAAPEAAVRRPYLTLALLLVAIAVLVMATSLPQPGDHGPARSNALRHRHLRLGMVAIFCYVGAEVTIGSLLISFLGLPEVMGLPETSAKNYLSLYWGGAMTGRFLGALALSGRIGARRRMLMLPGLAIVLFAVLALINNASDGLGFEQLWPMLILISANMVAFMIAGPRPSIALGIFATIAMTLLALAVAFDGAKAMWSLIAIGLFNSILWSNIFTLAIDGLKEDTSQGSSLLVMMIVGGALVPPLQGLIADNTGCNPPSSCHGLLCLPGLVRFLRKPPQGARMILGIDIGGTTTKLGLVDGHRVSAHSAVDDGPATLMSMLSRMRSRRWRARSSIAAEPSVPSASAHPNGNQHTGTIHRAPNLPWKNDVPLASMIGKRLGVPCVLGNDAKRRRAGGMEARRWARLQ
jgi:FHS family L-fucose permease-like MFS transporter